MGIHSLIGMLCGQSDSHWMQAMHSLTYSSLGQLGGQVHPLAVVAGLKGVPDRRARSARYGMGKLCRDSSRPG
jgi:hypothetical protein